MDIFIDSGVAIGYSDIGDIKFHSACVKFLDLYPQEENGYYSIKYIIKEEIRSTEMKRLIQRKKNIIRLFPQRAKIFCNYITDIANRSHASFNTLFTQIHDHLLKVRKDKKRKEHDAKLLTSAFIWAHEDKTLITPRFVTTDWWDICINRPTLYNFALGHLPDNPLKIRFVIDFAP